MTDLSDAGEIVPLPVVQGQRRWVERCPPRKSRSLGSRRTKPLLWQQLRSFLALQPGAPSGDVISSQRSVL